MCKKYNGKNRGPSSSPVGVYAELILLSLFIDPSFVQKRPSKLASIENF